MVLYVPSPTLLGQYGREKTLVLGPRGRQEKADDNSGTLQAPEVTFPNKFGGCHYKGRIGQRTDGGNQIRGQEEDIILEPREVNFSHTLTLVFQIPEQ